MGGDSDLIEDLMRESKEEFRFQAREGFTVVEKGQQIVIERTAQEPLVLTFPKVHELDPLKRLRYALDLSVTWLFFFLAWSAFYLATQAQKEALARATAAGRRGERSAGRAGPGAALPGQSAFPVQHAQLAVVAGDDRPHRPRRNHAACAVHVLPQQPFVRAWRRCDAR